MDPWINFEFIGGMYGRVVARRECKRPSQRIAKRLHENEKRRLHENENEVIFLKSFRRFNLSFSFSMK